MPGAVTFQRPIEIEDRALKPGQKKLCPALAWWRTDAPESRPYCVTCGKTITVGTPYVVAYPVYVYCCACGNPDGRLR